jgi:EmrB/QacA subfamily drug resistance transporter
MVILDGTIINVALPSIRTDLGFDASSLVWVVNGYMIPYGGFLLLCGRLGDHFGHRRAFAFGIALFTVASLGCALASSVGVLIGGRIVQGVAAAAVQAVAMSLILEEFEAEAERSRALAIYSCVLCCGSSSGVLLGGVLTSTLSWRWIFLVNLPIGALVYGICGALQFHTRRARGNDRIDITGALLITTSLTLAVSAVVNAANAQWWSAYVLAPLGGAVLLFLGFLALEARTPSPLVPLTLFRHQPLRTGVVANALGAATLSAWFFISALNLALIFGQDALKAGLAYLPATALAALFPLGLASPLIRLFGARPLVVAGLVCEAAALVLLARAPVQPIYVRDLFPGMLVIGLGAGLVYAPLLLSALSGVDAGGRGVASGVFHSAGVMGQALGIALATTIGAAWASHLIGAGIAVPTALHDSYGVAYLFGAAIAVGGALVSLAGYFRARD